MQTLGRFMVYLGKAKQKWSKREQLEGVFLANHKKGYKNEITQRLKAPDYSKDTYYGSLLQHITSQLGSARNPDRMALLSGLTNQRKGNVWGNTTIEMNVDAVYNLARINNYMIREKEGFCATVNGIYEILQRFHDARMDDPMDGLCDLFDEAKINPRTSGSDSASSEPTSSEPASDPEDHSYLPPQLTDKVPFKDEDRPSIAPKHAVKQDYSFHNHFVIFMKQEIKDIGTNMQTNIDKILKSVIIPVGGDPLKGFKVTFPDELLKCSALSRPVAAREVKGSNNGRESSSSRKVCSNSSTRISTPRSGAASTGTMNAPSRPTKTSSGTATMPTSPGKDPKLSPTAKTIRPTTISTPCKKGRKC